MEKVGRIMGVLRWLLMGSFFCFNVCLDRYALMGKSWGSLLSITAAEHVMLIFNTYIVELIVKILLYILNLLQQVQLCYPKSSKVLGVFSIQRN